jgi:hypothetical protein
LVLASALIPYVSLYPLYRPWHGRSAEQVEHPVNTVYVDAETGEQVARLIGYNLPEPFASPGTYYPIELCWESLGQTDVPYAVFVQLLDLSQLNTFDAPGIWGRRDTYPGLGNLPTSRWPLHKTFCDTLMTWVYPQAPTPLGAAIEVGFLDPQSVKRLQPVDSQGEPASLTYVGGVPILSPQAQTSASPPLYVLDGAIGLNRVQFGTALTLTWQALNPVPYDATMFVHVKGKDGNTLAQVDRQPLNGRFPTSYWLPGQVITDVVHLSVPDTYKGPLTLNIGMYTWPSLTRLSVVDAAGTPQQHDMIVVTRP